MKLTYAVIRFVPDSARAEFINVGLLVGDEPSGSCQVTIDNTRRLAYAIADRATVDTVWSYLGDLKVGLERHRAQWKDFSFSSEWLRGHSFEAGNLLQFSPPAPVAAGALVTASAIRAPGFLHAFGTAPGDANPRRNTLIAHV